MDPLIHDVEVENDELESFEILLDDARNIDSQAHQQDQILHVVDEDEERRWAGDRDDAGCC